MRSVTPACSANSRAKARTDVRGVKSLMQLWESAQSYRTSSIRPYLRFLPLKLSDQDREALAKAYGK